MLKDRILRKLFFYDEKNYTIIRQNSFKNEKAWNKNAINFLAQQISESAGKNEKQRPPKFEPFYFCLCIKNLLITWVTYDHTYFNT